MSMPDYLYFQDGDDIDYEADFWRKRHRIQRHFYAYALICRFANLEFNGFNPHNPNPRLVLRLRRIDA